MKKSLIALSALGLVAAAAAPLAALAVGGHATCTLSGAACAPLAGQTSGAGYSFDGKVGTILLPADNVTACHVTEPSSETNAIQMKDERTGKAAKADKKDVFVSPLIKVKSGDTLEMQQVASSLNVNDQEYYVLQCS